MRGQEDKEEKAFEEMILPCGRSETIPYGDMKESRTDRPADKPIYSGL